MLFILIFYCFLNAIFQKMVVTCFRVKKTNLEFTHYLSIAPYPDKSLRCFQKINFPEIQNKLTIIVPLTNQV